MSVLRMLLIAFIFLGVPSLSLAGIDPESTAEASVTTSTEMIIEAAVIEVEEARSVEEEARSVEEEKDTITVAKREPLPFSLPYSSLYFGFGIGASTISPELAGTYNIANKRSSSNQFMLGYRFSKRWDVELFHTDLGEVVINPQNQTLSYREFGIQTRYTGNFPNWMRRPFRSWLRTESKVHWRPYAQIGAGQVNVTWTEPVQNDGKWRTLGGVGLSVESTNNYFQWSTRLGFIFYGRDASMINIEWTLYSLL